MVREPQLNRPSTQRGDVLLITLMVMTLMALGMLYAMRFVVTDTAIAGNNLARQKGGQATDLGLRYFQQTQLAPYAALNQDLSSFAASQPWMNLNPLTTPYAPSLWQSGVSTHPNHSTFTLPASATAARNYSFSAMVFPIPTPIAGPDSCGTGMQMRYYDVFIFAKESPGATSATSETVFNLCAY